jgi:hypothetical protein
MKVKHSFLKQGNITLYINNVVKKTPVLFAMASHDSI